MKCKAVYSFSTRQLNSLLSLFHLLIQRIRTEGLICVSLCQFLGMYKSNPRVLGLQEPIASLWALSFFSQGQVKIEKYHVAHLRSQREAVQIVFTRGMTRKCCEVEFPYQKNRDNYSDSRVLCINHRGSVKWLSRCRCLHNNFHSLLLAPIQIRFKNILLQPRKMGALINLEIFTIIFLLNSH